MEDLRYTSGVEHSPTSSTGTECERTPWRATQRAAWVGAERALMPGEKRPLTRRDVAVIIVIGVIASFVAPSNGR
jgi:hypothetical protein